MVEYILLILCWAIYFFCHSLFANDRVKKYFNQLLGTTFRYYRLAYNLFSVIGLGIIVVLNASITSFYFYERSGWTQYLSLFIATGSIFVFKAAFRQFSVNEFLGITRENDKEFKVGGILKHIQHPIYTGTILMVIGFWLFIPNIPTLVSACCIFIYLAIGIPLEERKLIKKYGDAYIEYKKNVPALIPRLK